MRCLFVLSALLFGCSFESIDDKPDEINSSPLPTNYYSAGGNDSNNCPPPVTLIVILDGKPTTQTYIEHCFTSKAMGEYGSDPSGWGNDNYDDPNYNADSVPNLKPPAPGDPIPN